MSFSQQALACWNGDQTEERKHVSGEKKRVRNRNKQEGLFLLSLLASCLSLYIRAQPTYQNVDLWKTGRRAPFKQATNARTNTRKKGREERDQIAKFFHTKNPDQQSVRRKGRFIVQVIHQETATTPQVGEELLPQHKEPQGHLSSGSSHSLQDVRS